MSLKKLIAIVLGLGFVAAAGGAVFLIQLSNKLPQIMKVEDYKPLLVSEVYARGGEKIGEFYRENRTVVPYEKIPKQLVNSFLAAEDDTFFTHGGVNYTAQVRALLANARSGKYSQGASTITQQVAKSLLLSPEKTLSRKFKEILLAYRMEAHLSKEEILYLYLNQIYFGEGAYGVAAAAETYFRKSLDQLTVAECALMAGLPQAPSRYSPVDHPKQAKDRQRYVLNRLTVLGKISKEQELEALKEPIKVYAGKEYKSVAPYFVEEVRQMLVQELGEDQVLDGGLRIYTSLDFKAQNEAQNQVREGLRAVDKREGYRGPLRHLKDGKEVDEFLLASRKNLIREKYPLKEINPDGSFSTDVKKIEVFHKRDGSNMNNLPPYVDKDSITEAVVTNVDDNLGLVTVRFAEVQALLDLSDMSWARKPDPKVPSAAVPPVKLPSLVLKKGDIILVRVTGSRFYSTRLVKVLGKTHPTGLPDLNAYAEVALEQEPIAEGALLSFDQRTQDVLAMVGGYDFKRSEYNRALQANRQTGSSFKAITYASALDKGYTGATEIVDAPVVFEEKDDSGDAEDNEEAVKKWKPHNYENKFEGDVLFRTALVHSMNIPTVKIQTDIGIDWTMDYAHRLGVFSPLNKDVTLALGSSALTLFEMTKVFSEFGRMGQRIRPQLVHKVVDPQGKVLLEKISLDRRYEKETSPWDQYFEQKRSEILTAEAAPTTGGAAPPPVKKHPNLYFADPEQLISPQTSYLITSLLQAVINDPGGTGGAARALGRPVAGKTGTTNGYYDTWFMGYTPQIATGVWVGFDKEQSLGIGEAGARTALPIWLEYMKFVHQGLPVQSFPVPNGIVFANIDAKTGRLASAASQQVVQQAFLAGTAPQTSSDASTGKEETDFYKEDLTQ